MKNYFASAVFGFIIMLGTLAKADPRSAWVHCGRDLDATNTVMATALRNLMSFEGVHAAIGEIENSVPQAQYCVSGVILSKNIYQYGKFLISIEVYDGATNRVLNRMYFLYQDASVQAIHNVGGKPYVALPRIAVEDILQKALTESITKTHDISPAESLMNVVQTSETYRGSQPAPDVSSISALEVPGGGLIITWLTQLPSNPYAGYALLKGLSIDRAPLGEGGRMRSAEFRPFSQLLEKRLDDLQGQVQAGLPAQGLKAPAAAQKILDESKL